MSLTLCEHGTWASSLLEISRVHDWRKAVYRHHTFPVLECFGLLHMPYTHRFAPETQTTRRSWSRFSNRVIEIVTMSYIYSVEAPWNGTLLLS